MDDVGKTVGFVVVTLAILWIVSGWTGDRQALGLEQPGDLLTLVTRAGAAGPSPDSGSPPPDGDPGGWNLGGQLGGGGEGRAPAATPVPQPVAAEPNREPGTAARAAVEQAFEQRHDEQGQAARQAELVAYAADWCRDLAGESQAACITHFTAHPEDVGVIDPTWAIPAQDPPPVILSGAKDRTDQGGNAAQDPPPPASSGSAILDSATRWTGIVSRAISGSDPPAKATMTAKRSQAEQCAALAQAAAAAAAKAGQGPSQALEALKAMNTFKEACQ